jgi:uncharacterized Zn finger protein
MWGEWKPYVSVAQRRENAKKQAAKMAKMGTPLEPIVLAGRTIAKTFWGKAWCDNLESYSDYANRLPRGRTYVRNGSVIDLKISEGRITALVSGSELYTVTVNISPVASQEWKAILQDCARSVDSLMDLLQGKFSKGVMERLTRQKEGLFPHPKAIDVDCSCPDWASMCKHVAAVLYGVGARLDVDPQLLFRLRKVDHQELIRVAVESRNLEAALDSDSGATLAGEDLGAMFGIELATAEESAEPSPSKSTKRRKAASQPPLASAAVNQPTTAPASDTARSKRTRRSTDRTPSNPTIAAKKATGTKAKAPAVQSGGGRKSTAARQSAKKRASTRKKSASTK